MALSSPYGTLTANLVGCFGMGVFYAVVSSIDLKPQTILILQAGFFGAFTTFSTFALDFFKFYEEGQAFKGSLYVLASVLAGILLLILGVKLTTKYVL